MFGCAGLGWAVMGCWEGLRRVGLCVFALCLVMCRPVAHHSPRQVPALLTDEGPLNETAAIMLYISSASDRLAVRSAYEHALVSECVARPPATETPAAVPCM